MKTTNPRSSDGSPCDCARVAEDPGIASAYGFPRPAVQQVPLFYTVGVSARGLFDARPRDGVGFGIAAGYFSNELQRAQRDGRRLLSEAKDGSGLIFLGAAGRRMDPTTSMRTSAKLPQKPVSRMSVFITSTSSRRC